MGFFFFFHYYYWFYLLYLHFLILSCNCEVNTVVFLSLVLDSGLILLQTQSPTVFNVGVHFLNRDKKQTVYESISDTAKRLLKILITTTAFGFILVIDCIKGLSNLSIFQVSIIFNGFWKNINLICAGTSEK